MNIDSRVEKLEDRTSSLNSDVSVIKTELKYLRYIFVAIVVQLVGEVGLFLSEMIKL